jgi:hypothetical protein
MFLKVEVILFIYPHEEAPRTFFLTSYFTAPTEASHEIVAVVVPADDDKLEGIAHAVIVVKLGPLTALEVFNDEHAEIIFHSYVVEELKPEIVTFDSDPDVLVLTVIPKGNNVIFVTVVPLTITVSQFEEENSLNKT